MKTKDFIARFLIIFMVAFIANVLIAGCWNYFVKSQGFVTDWETSFRMALVLAIVIPLSRNKWR
jgi:hypothetical protein